MYRGKQKDGPWHHMTPGGCWFPWSTFSSSGRRQKTTTKTVTGNDRPCQQPYLSSWPHQAWRKNKRVHAHSTWSTLAGGGGINGATQCKHNLLANKQSGLLFLFFPQLHLFSFSLFLHLRVFPKSHVGLIWLIAPPDIHPATGKWGNERKTNSEKTRAPYLNSLCGYISFFHSARRSICLPLSLLLPLRFFPAICVSSPAFNPLPAPLLHFICFPFTKKKHSSVPQVEVVFSPYLCFSSCPPLFRREWRHKMSIFG